jgi:hypothetical protein
MKKIIVSAMAAVGLALPAAAAYANDDLTVAIQEGQRNAAPADVTNEVGVSETHQAGEIGQQGQLEQLGELATSNEGTAHDSGIQQAGDVTTHDGGSQQSGSVPSSDVSQATGAGSGG